MSPSIVSGDCLPTISIEEVENEDVIEEVEEIENDNEEESPESESEAS